MRPAGVKRHEIAVCFIEDHPYSALPAQVENLAQQVGRIYGAAGIVRRHDRDRAGLRADRGGDIVRARQHAVRCVAVNIANPDAEHAESGLMVEVAGARHQDFIAMAGDGQRRRDEGLIAS